MKEIRKLKNYSRVKVSFDLNMSRETLFRSETGARNPDIETLLRFSEYYNASIDYLIRGEKFKKKKTRVNAKIPSRVFFL